MHFQSQRNAAKTLVSYYKPAFSIHMVVVFVWVVLYRTWMLLWNQVVVFIAVVVFNGSVCSEFVW